MRTEDDVIFPSPRESPHSLAGAAVAGGAAGGVTPRFWTRRRRLCWAACIVAIFGCIVGWLVVLAIPTANEDQSCTSNATWSDHDYQWRCLGGSGSPTDAVRRLQSLLPTPPPFPPLSPNPPPFPPLPPRPPPYPPSMPSPPSCPMPPSAPPPVAPSPWYPPSPPEVPHPAPPSFPPLWREESSRSSSARSILMFALAAATLILALLLDVLRYLRVHELLSRAVLVLLAELLPSLHVYLAILRLLPRENLPAWEDYDLFLNCSSHANLLFRRQLLWFCLTARLRTRVFAMRF